jgi:hypothetical protein
MPSALPLHHSSTGALAQLGPPPSTSGWLTPLLSSLLQEWRPLISVAYDLHNWFAQDRNRGMYEIMAYDTTLEMLDSRGHSAVVNKRQTVHLTFFVA